MVGLVWFDRFGLFGLVWFGLGCFGLVWFGRLGVVNEDDFRRPQVPLKVAKAKLELHIEPIPARVGSVRSGPVRSNSDYKAISVQLQLQLPTGTELGNKTAKHSTMEGKL